MAAMNDQEYAARIEEKYPGIMNKLGDQSFTLECIGSGYGLTRERVRQYEERLGMTPRAEFRTVKAKLNALERKKQKAIRKLSKQERFEQSAKEVSKLIEAGASKDEIASALPWKIKSGKTPFSMRVSMYVSKLRMKTGIKIPKMYPKNRLP